MRIGDGLSPVREVRQGDAVLPGNEEGVAGKERTPVEEGEPPVTIASDPGNESDGRVLIALV